MIKIVWANGDITFDYAARELKKYLDKVSGTVGFAKLCKVDALPAEIEQGSIQLGLLNDFNLDSTGVLDSALDDLVDLKVEKGTGYIAGSNPRSVLFGIYDYFKSAGCYWVRPGVGGEHLEFFDPMEHSFTFRKLADVRFRGECLEGATKYEHVRAAIEWSPKVHMNLFMIQGHIPYVFFKAWYTHDYNPYMENEDIGYDGTKQITDCVEQDIRRCGLQFHGLGHFYQSEPYGIRYITSGDKYEMNEQMQNALALVGGERKFRGSPSWSQLCMGKDEVLKTQVKWLADYAESKPHLDFLHVWMGDGTNNHCECELCTPHHPTDLYIKMLNMLDSELTRRGLNTKVCFCAYIDTMWAPKVEKLNNPDRFILEQSITARDYCKPYDTTPFEGEIPVWQRNKYNLPADFKVFREMFKEWKKVFKGPAFAFEYHYYTEHFNDIGTMINAKNYYSDLHQLENLGYNGMVNCQTQRIAFPSAFHVALCGEALFDLSRSFEDLRNEYFKAAFGEESEKVIAYLTNISNLYHPEIIGGAFNVAAMDKLNKGWLNNKLLADDLKKIPALVDDFLDSIAKLDYTDNALCRSFKLLKYHGEYCKKISDVMLTAAGGDIAGAKQKFDKVYDYYCKIESEIEYEFDLLLFKQCYTNKLKV